MTGSWQAWCSLTGTLLAGLGGLYLAYDLLGGRTGPLAVVTRVATYSLMFGLGYALVLGLRFALIVSLGLGASLGIEQYAAARRSRRGGGGKSYRVVLLIAALRSFAVALALASTVSLGVGLVYFPAYALYVVLYNVLGFAPADHRRALPRPAFHWPALVASLLYGAGAACCLATAYALTITAAIAPEFTPVRFGGIVALVALIGSLINPVIEYWVERIPKRTLALVGASFAIFGFLLQALPNWVVLLR